MLAYRAVEAGERERLAGLLDEHPELVRQRGTNGNDLLGMAGDLESVKLLLERGADVNRGNDYGWTKLHQAGYSNDRTLGDAHARGRRARRPLGARRRRHAARGGALLGAPRGGRPARARAAEPARRRRARPGRPDRRARRGRRLQVHTGRSTVLTAAFPPGSRPTTGRRSSTRRSSGRPRPTGSRRSIGSSSSARTSRRIPIAARRSHGLLRTGRVAAIRRLVELGADPNGLGTFGGPTHGEGVPPLHLAAQSGQEAAVDAPARARGRPDHPRPALRRQCRGWAAHGCRPDLADRLE